jgi:phosphomannomutase
MDTRDGVKVIVPDGWLLVRGSNTEPIIRVVAEARSEERARNLVDDVIARISR